MDKSRWLERVQEAVETHRLLAGRQGKEDKFNRLWTAERRLAHKWIEITPLSLDDFEFEV